MKKLLTYVLVIAVAWLPLLMGAFDKDKPAASTSLRSSNPEILANWAALETAIDNEHAFATGGTQDGDHTQGSARCFSQASAPATRIDGNGFEAGDLGSLWVDTDDNALYILTVTTPTWTPVSTEVIATLLASARTFGSTLDVTGTLTASGAVTVGTTLDVTGNIDPTTYETTNGGFLDEDAMGSDAADKVASQQSIKAYVDNNIGSANWTPASYAGEQSITFPNGLIMKQGTESVAANTTDEVTYSAAFPTAFVNSWCTLQSASADIDDNVACQAKAASETSILQVTNGGDLTFTIQWFAIGY